MNTTVLAAIITIMAALTLACRESAVPTPGPTEAIPQTAPAIRPEAPPTTLAFTAATSPSPTQQGERPTATKLASTQAPIATPTVSTAPPPGPHSTPSVDPTPANQPLRTMDVANAFPNLHFRKLTNLAQPDDGSERLFVTEQDGRILVFPNEQQIGKASLFLDIQGRVNTSHNEEGLLGLAFDPDYKDNGRFYVYYSASNPRRSVISRFKAHSQDPDIAEEGSELIILEILQPHGNHNGGDLQFGPDGHLYISLGDGGAGGDPHGNGQNRRTLLGSILRIDVSEPSQQDPYAVPPDNPFVGIPDFRPEIWAYGLRNPWRISIDAATGLLWAGDVGQSRWEEIDLIEKGRNYGWNIMEGGSCFAPRANCDTTGLHLPLVEYSSDQGCSVIGGYVYRGLRLPALRGAYVYGDFCSGLIWALRYDGQRVTEHLLIVATGLQITSFGRDLNGELYVLSRNDGIFRLTEGD